MNTYVLIFRRPKNFFGDTVELKVFKTKQEAERFIEEKTISENRDSEVLGIVEPDVEYFVFHNFKNESYKAKFLNFKDEIEKDLLLSEDR